jgi:hypothetical protein
MVVRKYPLIKGYLFIDNPNKQRQAFSIYPNLEERSFN